MKTTYRRRLEALAIILVGTTASWCMAQADPEKGDKAVNVLLFGDSHMLSDKTPEGKRLPDYVAKSLKALSKGTVTWKVTNSGVGGETAASGLARISQSLRGQDVVVIEYGGNDMWQKRSADQFRKDLEGLVAAVRDAKSHVVLATAPPLDEQRHFFGKDPEYIKAGGANRVLERTLNHETRLVCKDKDVPLCDLHRLMWDPKKFAANIMPDGVHFTELGNALAGEAIARCVLASYQARILQKKEALTAEKKALDKVAEAKKKMGVKSQVAKQAGTKCLGDAETLCPYLPDISLLLESAGE